jgi:hypothetical protein
MLFWSKKFVWQQDKDLKYTFSIHYFTVLSIIGFKKCHTGVGGGGGQKRAEKVSRIIWMAPKLNAQFFVLVVLLYTFLVQENFA